jgi:hypothetical protein
MDFVSSLFEALRVQRSHILKKRSDTGALPDYTTITLSRVNVSHSALCACIMYACVANELNLFDLHVLNRICSRPTVQSLRNILSLLKSLKRFLERLVDKTWWALCFDFVFV